MAISDGGMTIPNPYPDPERDAMPERVQFETPLWLMRAADSDEVSTKRESQYVVAADYRISYRLSNRRDERLELTVPAGMLTDLTSVPRIGRWFVGRVGPHLEAAIVHDFLFIAWQDALLDGKPMAARRADFDFANAMMNEAMKAADVGWLKRSVIIAAVSSPIGWAVYRERDPGDRYIDMTRFGEPRLVSAVAQPAA